MTALARLADIGHATLFIFVPAIVDVLLQLELCKRAAQRRRRRRGRCRMATPSVETTETAETTETNDRNG